MKHCNLKNIMPLLFFIHRLLEVEKNLHHLQVTTVVFSGFVSWVVLGVFFLDINKSVAKTV